VTRIDVTKPFLPPVEEYIHYVEKVWQSNQLTNQGPFLREFEREVSAKLEIESNSFQFVANGTIALQVALKALGVSDGEVITTPFSYVATTSAILWERCKPVYVDINPDTYCIDASKIERAITPRTRAIVAVHVFGNPCEVDKINEIAQRHNLKVIYDAAHAFGVKYNNQSLLKYGDISTCSFHATKLFHTVEGGAIICHDKRVNEEVDLIKRFGHIGDDHQKLGINAKSSELNAAMGLCNLKYIDQIIEKRKLLSDVYNKHLSNIIKTMHVENNTVQNYAYYPIMLHDEKSTLKLIELLNSNDIYPRRYFYPSLNTLPYVKGKKSCPVSEDTAVRILCLPLFYELTVSEVELICGLIKEMLNDV